MTTRALDPLRLPVASFAADEGDLDGEWPVASMPRLADSECPPDGAPAGTHPNRAELEPGRSARWRAVGSLRPVGGQHQIWLALRAEADVVLQCQRCLQPVALAVEVDRQFRFVEDEATAERIDDEIEDEVLALPRALDLRELLEDELLLALPLVPHHEVCPEPLPASFGEDEIAPEPEAHPFAALAALKKAP